MPNPLRIGLLSTGASYGSYYQPDLLGLYKYVKSIDVAHLLDCYDSWPIGGTLTRHVLAANTQYEVSSFITSDVKRIEISGAGIIEFYNP